jgi:hypothetical protein
MDGMSVAKIARLIVVRDSECAGTADSYWRTDSLSGILVRERVYFPPGLVLIPLIVHGGEDRVVQLLQRDGISSPE